MARRRDPDRRDPYTTGMAQDPQAELKRIEEAQGFSDRRIDTLEEEVRDLYTKLERIAGRVSRLEGRLDEIGAQPEPDEGRPDQPPPQP